MRSEDCSDFVAACDATSLWRRRARRRDTNSKKASKNACLFECPFVSFYLLQFSPPPAPPSSERPLRAPGLPSSAYCGDVLLVAEQYECRSSTSHSCHSSSRKRITAVCASVFSTIHYFLTTILFFRQLFMSIDSLVQAVHCSLREFFL